MHNKVSTERKESNRKHHFEFWQDSYSEVQKEYADDVIRLLRIIKRFKYREKQMKHIDIIRRENAFHMGVGLAESDMAYSFEDQIKGIKTLIDTTNKELASVGLSYAAFVKDDDATID